MAGIRDELYAALREDFDNSFTGSFLYRYLEREKEDSLRLRLKERRAALRDDPASRGSYAAFLADRLLSDPRLRRLYGRMETLGALLALEDPAAAGRGDARQIRQTLSRLRRRLERGELDAPMELLDRVTEELLALCPHPAERGDAYVQLREASLDWRLGRLSQTELLRASLSLLGKNSKLRLGEECRTILLACARRLGVSAGGRPRQRCRALLEALDRNPPQEDPLSRREMEALSRGVLEAILIQDARTFLYDGGSPAQGGVGPGRKRDRTMDVLDAYCRENRLTLQRPSAGAWELTEEEIARYEALFERLRAGKNEGVFLPVRIDPATGAGVFIVGRDYFRDVPSLYRSIRGACCYACLYWNDLTLEDGYGLSLSCLADREELGELCGFPHLREAMDWSAHILRREAMEFYREKNGPPPEHCPDALRGCFAAGPAGQPITQEEIRRARRELGMDLPAGPGGRDAARGG